MFKEALENIELTESFYRALNELVSSDCADGKGPATKLNDWTIVRTKHLDAPREPDSDIQRDAGWNCQKFQKVISLFLKHKRIKIRKGKYNLMYKENKFFEMAVIEVRPETKEMVFVTIMTLDKDKQSEYRNPKKEKRVYIGVLK